MVRKFVKLSARDLIIIKSFKQGLLVAALLFVLSVFNSKAVEGLQISTSCADVVLTWPTVDGSGDTYMICRRADLSTNSTWVIIADQYAAATGTNQTVYIDSGVITNAICGGGDGMSMGRRGFATLDIDAKNISTNLPPLPPGFGDSQTDLYGHSFTADDSGPLTPSGTNDDSGSTNLMQVEIGFYKVVKDGLTIYGLTNGQTVSGIVTLPMEAANYYGSLSTLSLEDDNGIIASTIHNLPFEDPVPLISFDTTLVSNGVHHISAYGQWIDPGDGTEDGSAANFDVTNAPITVTVSNEISFPNWMPQFGELYSDLLVHAQSATTNVQWYLDVYDSSTNYIGTLEGTDTNCDIYIVWDLVGPHGETYTDNTFEFILSTAQGPTLVASVVVPPIYRVTDPWAGPGDWVVVNQQAWNSLLNHEDLDTMADGFTTIAFACGLAARPFTGDGSSYRIHYGGSSEPTDWAAFRSALYNPLSRNLFYLGHGTTGGLGYNTVNTNIFIPSTEIGSVLGNIPTVATNRHKYRCAIIDGCSTAAGNLPEAFGIIHKENVLDTTYSDSGIRPAAFAGWDNDTAAGFLGSVSPSHVNFFQHFQFEWLSNERGIKDAFTAAAGYPDDTFVSPKHLKVYGAWFLTVNGFNR